jgi:ABC-type transport system involved in cytochrome c biogenesis ATPase subunit
MPHGINCIIQPSGLRLPRKHIARVVLSQQQKDILDSVCARLGQSESETLRAAFMEYAKSINMVTEKVHQKNRSRSASELA